VTTDAAIARLERLVDDDEIFTLQRVARGQWEAWSFLGDVGRGATAAAAAAELAGKLR
jgi:hypothetical protein